MTVKELREKNKLSQAAMAKSLGVSTSAISSVEAGRMKVSEKLADKIKEVYGEIVEPEVKKAEAVVAEPAEEAAKKVAAKAKKTKAAVKTKAKKAATETAAAAKETAVKAEKKAEKKVKEVKKSVKKQAAEIFIQSAMGGEITPEAILAKVGEVDKVYVRVDENKAYWVKGEESGAVDLW